MAWHCHFLGQKWQWQAFLKRVSCHSWTHNDRHIRSSEVTSTLHHWVLHFFNKFDIFDLIIIKTININDNWCVFVENKSKCFEVTPRQIIMGGVTGLIWVDLKNPVTDSHSCHSCHCLSPCHSCHSWKCDGIIYSKTMQFHRVVVFDPCICFWKFSLDFHFPLLLHCFYSNLHRVQAEISSFYSWTKFFHEWTYFDVILPETVDSRNVVFVALWSHFLCSTITSLVVCAIFLAIFFIVLLNFSFLIYWNVIYLQFCRESHVSLTKWKLTTLVTVTAISVDEENLHDKEEK